MTKNIYFTELLQKRVSRTTKTNPGAWQGVEESDFQTYHIKLFKMSVLTKSYETPKKQESITQTKEKAQSIGIVLEEPLVLELLDKHYKLDITKGSYVKKLKKVLE